MYKSKPILVVMLLGRVGRVQLVASEIGAGVEAGIGGY